MVPEQHREESGQVLSRVVSGELAGVQERAFRYQSGSPGDTVYKANCPVLTPF